MELLGRELGTHWADFGNVKPNPNSHVWEQPAGAVPPRPTRSRYAQPVGDYRDRLCGRLQRPVAFQPGLFDGERTKLGNQLNELEIAERILTRFGGTAEATEKRSRGRRARIAPAAGGRSRARGGQQAPTLSMSDGILKAVQAHGDGITANEVLDYLSREFGMTVRPNHPGIALQRHRRAGRLENRDQRWYLPASAQSEQ